MPGMIQSSLAVVLVLSPATWLQDPLHLGLLGAVLLGLGLIVILVSIVAWVYAGRDAGNPPDGLEENDFLPLPPTAAETSEGGSVRRIPVREESGPEQRPAPAVQLFPEDWGVMGEIPGAVVILFHGRIRCGTREFARQLGVPPETLVGREFKEFVAPEDLLRVVEQIEALDRGRRQRCHLSIRLRGGPPGRPPLALTAVRVPYGGEHMVLVSFSPVLVTAVGPLLQDRDDSPAGDGADAGPVPVPADPSVPAGTPDPVTDPLPDRPTAVANANQTQGEAAELLATVSHELQTPLVSVRGYTEMILKGRMGPITVDQERGLKISLRNIDRLIERIDELLELSRPVRPSGKDRPTDFSLWEVIDEAIEMVQEKTSQRGVNITTSYLAGNLQVRADREQIQKVFVNLLHNAIKFNRDGGSVRVTVRDRSAARLEVEVRDTGIGIPRHALGKIFERYFRVGDPQAAGTVGTGLGLSIVKSILDRIGCEIGVASEVSVGTAFTFTLPRSADRAAGAERRR
jgi:signal transduction histidine kinase